MSNNTPTGAIKDAKITNKRCYLLELPAELRLHIYGYLLDGNNHGSHIARNESTAALLLPESSAEIHLARPYYNLSPPLAFALRTCKKIQQEAEPLVRAHLGSRPYTVHTRMVAKSEKFTPYSSNRIGRTWPIEDCPLLGHIRHLEITIVSLGSSHYEDDSVMEPLRRFLECIDYGSNLVSLRVDLPGSWRNESMATLLGVLDALRCEWTVRDKVAPVVARVRERKRGCDRADSAR